MASVHHIGILRYHGTLLSALYGLTEQFAIGQSMAARHSTGNPPLLQVTHWQPKADGTMEVVYRSHPELEAGEPEIVIVPPSIQTSPLEGVDMVPIRAWLAQRHEAGATLGSVCAGAFVLAEAGLLAERTVTTHWQYAEMLAKEYPAVHVDGDKLLIEDGDLLTAGGMMAWTDLGLRLIHRLLGPTVMMETARFMLVDPPGREQRYYSTFAPRLTHGDGAILKVQHWLQVHAGTQVTLPQMARHAGLELRTFLRHFTKATGLKPTEYVQQLRVGKAREMLEFSTVSVEQIAWKVGYEDASAFRRVFKELTGLTAGEYRGRFGVVA